MGDDDVGSFPLVVYLIVAPEVEHDILTDWAEVYVPPEGVKVGVATDETLGGN